MCTAVSVWGKRHLFGRTLDLSHTYGEAVVLTPRHFPLAGVGETHHVLLGVAHLFGGEPLYYDAVNEHGLCGAALHFPGETVYGEREEGKLAIPSYALISYVLGLAKTVEEVKELLQCAVITGEPVDDALPTAPLHWIFADRQGAVTVESVKTGLMVYDNPVGVLTNPPEFPRQLVLLGERGLQGDLSSVTRFGRAAFYKTRTVVGDNAEEAVRDFFHLMATVSVPKGAVCTAEGDVPCTQYTACADTSTGAYFYTTYGCPRIRAVTLRDKNLDGDTLFTTPLTRAVDVLYQ